MALQHTVKGAVGYTAVNNPTIVDGIASDFRDSPAAYLKTNSSFPNWSGISELDINVKAIVTTRNQNGYVFHMNNLAIATGGGASIFMVYIPGQSRYDIAYTLNTYYDIRVHLKDNVWSIYLDGVLKKTYEMTSPITSSTTPVGFGNTYTGANSLGFRGSIDLNHTYINVNGQPWFGLCPVEVQKHQLRGPVGYTVVGSPTIVDGVASGFSGSNVLQCPAFDVTKDFEIKTLVTFDSVGTLENIVSFSGTYSVLALNATTGTTASVVFLLQFKDNTGTIRDVYAVNSQLLCRVGIPYYMHFGRANGKIFLNISVDNNTWYSKTTSIPEGYTERIWTGIALGNIRNGGSPLLGSINLNHTYINVNGKLWFYQPADTKYIVKDGKLVWADPRIYLESDGNQYIQTDYTPVQGDDAKVSFFTSSNVTVPQTVYSAGTGTYQYTLIPYLTENQNARTYTKSFRTGGSPYFPVFPYTLWANYSQHNGVSKLEVSGNTYEVADTYQAPLDGNETTLWLFLRRNGQSPFYGKMKAFSITNNSVLKIHLVPVPTGLQIGNFTVPSNGMFDIVNQQFYANQGTGEFTIGRDE